MKFLARYITALSAFGLLNTGSPAYAQYAFFPNDTTINSTVTASYNIVGYASRNANSGFKTPSSPTVRLVSGGSISNYLSVFNHSTVIVSGGNVYDIEAYDNSIVNFISGTGFFLYANHSSTVNLSGGSIGAILFAGDSSTINLSGGSIDNRLEAIRNSTVNLSGGKISKYLIAADSSTVNLYGGSFGNTIYVNGDSIVNFFGTGLSDTLVDPNYPGGVSQYLLSGSLADGTNITGKQLYVQNGTRAKFTLNAVPEPGSVALLVGITSVSVGILRKRRR